MNNDQPIAYGKLCSMFYDATKAYAPEKEVAFFASFIEKQPGRVLEAMSGSGRLQIPLIQRGYVVDGVDNSIDMLNRCRQRCAELGLAPDIYACSLEKFNSSHRYTIVTIAVGSFQLIIEEDQALRALQTLRHHMMPGGTLLIDIFTPDTTVGERSVRVARLDARTTIRLTVRHVFDQQARRADAFCLYKLLVDGLAAEQENELLQTIWRTDEQWNDLLHRAGFKVITFHDEQFCTTRSSRVLQAEAV